jgi:alcohol dehydrogenase
MIYLFVLWLAHDQAVSALSTSMLEVRARGFCEAPFDDCVSLTSVDVYAEKTGYALIQVNSSSVNPSDVDSVEGGACSLGCGADVAGTIVSCPGCERLQEGDEVWTLASKTYAEFVSTPEANVGVRPSAISFTDAGTIPQVGVTSYMSLKRTDPGSPPGTTMPPGKPWANKENVTVVITAGSGGTGFIGIQLAKTWGAVNIITTSTGDGIAFCESLGATQVFDYMVEDVFDALPADSVDYVYDNYGAEGTADKAMNALRTGGVYLLLPHSECFVTGSQSPPCLSANPKEGVAQYNYVTGPDYAAYTLQGLDELKDLFDAGSISPRIDKVFPMSDIAAAFNYSAGEGEGGVTSGHYGKIAVVM